MNIRELINDASQQLTATSDTPRLDAEVLLCHVIQQNRAYLLTWPERELNSEERAQFQQLLKQRLKGQPVAHLTGEREFWSLTLQVTPDTLIPRPDTELLVEQILAAFPADAPIKLADLGTGSGAIAVAIASERPNWQILATDLSPEALAVAEHNARNLQLHNIEFRPGHWFDPLANERFDIIVSNPPYVADQDPHLNQGDVRFEPITALASGPEGLNDIEIIGQQALQHLNPGGLLIVEHGYDQAEKVLRIFQKNGYKDLQQTHDIAKNPRTTSGIKP